MSESGGGIGCCCSSCKEKEEVAEWRECPSCKKSFRYDKELGWTGAGLCPTCEHDGDSIAIKFLFWFLGLFFIGIPVFIKLVFYFGWVKEVTY